MRVLSVTDIKPGSAAGYAIFNERGDVLVQSGVVLDEERLAAIRAHGFSEMVVEDPTTQGIEIVDPLRPETRAQAARATRETLVIGEQAAFRLGPDTVARMTRLPNSAEALLAAREYDRAVKDADTARSAYTKLRDVGGGLRADVVQARARAAHGGGSDARARLDSALALARRLGDGDAERAVSLALAEVDALAQ